MQDLQQYLDEYDKNGVRNKILEGLYSTFDSKYLYAHVRKNKPCTIVDCAPRQGRTLSVICEALKRNQQEKKENINYFVFEKDESFYHGITEYCKTVSDVHFTVKNNILTYDFRHLSRIDFLFIDANHDYLLARWFLKNLFPLVKNGSIHVHDIYYNKNGKGWDDVGKLVCNENHPDMSDVNVLRGIYGDTIFNEYYDGNPNITRAESDEIRDFSIKNPAIPFVSTVGMGKEHEDAWNNSAVYFFINQDVTVNYV